MLSIISVIVTCMVFRILEISSVLFPAASTCASVSVRYPKVQIKVCVLLFTKYAWEQKSEVKSHDPFLAPMLQAGPVSSLFADP